MVEFFRDVLDGPLYIIVALLSLIFIMAIIGFIMERSKLAKDEKGRIAYVNNKPDSPMTPVDANVTQTAPTPVNVNDVKEEIPQKPDESNPSLLVKTPVVVFDDPDKKE